MQPAVKQEYTAKIAFIGIFLSIFAAFVSRLSIWRRSREPYKLQPFDLLLLTLSTFRLGRMVAYDRVAEPIRQPFTKTVPDETGAGESVEPRGEGLRQALGQLLSCPICAGTWIAAGLVYGLQTLTNPTRVFLAIMSTIGLAEILNALTEALSWAGQLARKLSGNGLSGLDLKKGADLSKDLFVSGGNYYVGHDHEKHYRQSGD